MIRTIRNRRSFFVVLIYVHLFAFTQLNAQDEIKLSENPDPGYARLQGNHEVFMEKWLPKFEAASSDEERGELTEQRIQSVSYTHLTLPTILLV